MEQKKEIKTLLDIERGDEVCGGVIRFGGGCRQNTGNFETFKVERIDYDFSLGKVTGIRLSIADCDIIFAEQLFDKSIYANKENWLRGRPIAFPNCKEIIDFIIKKFKLEYEMAGSSKEPMVWVWNEEKQEAKRVCFRTLDLLLTQLPEGIYANKYDCEKANKKMVDVEVVRCVRTVVDLETAEQILENPSKFQPSKNDEVFSSASIM